MRDDEPRPGTGEEPGTLTQGAPVFPGSSRLGNQRIEPKTPGWLVQDPSSNHQPIGRSDPKHQGILSPPRAGLGPVRNPLAEVRR